MRRYPNKYEGVGASTDFDVIFKSLKISVLDSLLGNTERQRLQQISEEEKENTKIDFSGTCVEFSKYSVPFQKRRPTASPKDLSGVEALPECNFGEISVTAPCHEYLFTSQWKSLLI